MLDSFIKVFDVKTMPLKWSYSKYYRAYLQYKEKDDIQECENYGRIKLMSHTMLLEITK